MPKQKMHLHILHTINRTGIYGTYCYRAYGKIVQEKREGIKFSNDDKDLMYTEKV